MAITTYAELKTAVASWLNRTDLTTAIPDFVALAEADIRRDVRVQAMETTATGSLSGTALAHPTRYTEARTMTVGGYRHEYRLPDEYVEALRQNATSRIYTSIGSAFYFPTNVSGGSYQLIYSAAFAAFTGASDTNWLLTNAPDVYLFGSLRWGAVYMKDTESTTTYLAMYLAAVKRTTSQEHAAAYSGSRLAVRPG